jgi:hypothetical protein
MRSLKMIRRIFISEPSGARREAAASLWRAACLLLTTALLAIGCGGELGTGEKIAAIHAAQLPPVGGCDTVARPALALKLRAVAGINDLYLVSAADGDVCIDSADGIRAMARRLNMLPPRELASSNPMPGDPGTSQDETSSNPMPGDPGNSNAGSNPMPGETHKNP